MAWGRALRRHERVGRLRQAASRPTGFAGRPDARRFVPSFDEPSYKATFSLSATVPAGDLALSNMPVASETPAADGKKTVVFQTSPKMSSYLLFFATGNFERLAAKSESRPSSIAAPPH